MDYLYLLLLKASGIVFEMGAAFSGLGGGFLIVSILLLLACTAQKPARMSFMTIFVISISGLLTYSKLVNTDSRDRILLGICGNIGAPLWS